VREETAFAPTPVVSEEGQPLRAVSENRLIDEPLPKGGCAVMEMETRGVDAQPPDLSEAERVEN
jgi:hypothetical protein